MRQITRILEIDAGHRLLQHEGKCRNLHGHRYSFEITMTAEKLDAVGRVVDFGVVKQAVGTWLDDTLDHAFIIQHGDPLLVFLLEHKQKHFIMSKPPTAENMAELVCTSAAVLLHDYPITVTQVRCWETPNSFADYFREV